MGRYGDKHGHTRDTNDKGLEVRADLTLQKPPDNVSSCLNDSSVKADILADLFIVVVLLCFGPGGLSILWNSAHLANSRLHNDSNFFHIGNNKVLSLPRIQNT